MQTLRGQRMIWLLIMILGAHSRALAQQGAPSDLAQPLHVTVSDVSQSYCMGQGMTVSGNSVAIGWLRFKLRLRVHNTSLRNIILCKKCDGPMPGVQLLSVNSDGSLGDIRYLGPDTDDYVLPKKVSRDPSRPDSNYVILKPGETFESVEAIGIMPTYMHRALESGDYFLRVVFWTWRHEASDTRRTLRVKWKSFGDLYTDVLAPDPIPIHIDIPEQAASCGYF
jgi:hypothetical protein